MRDAEIHLGELPSLPSSLAAAIGDGDEMKCLAGGKGEGKEGLFWGHTRVR